jgi:hypothetical protein
MDSSTSLEEGEYPKKKEVRKGCESGIYKQLDVPPKVELLSPDFM